MLKQARDRCFKSGGGTNVVTVRVGIESICDIDSAAEIKKTFSKLK